MSARSPEPPEVLVRPFQGPGGPWQISAGGTHRCLVASSPRELFYHGKPNSQGRPVAGYSVAGDSFSSALPHAWNDTRVDSFDLMPYGKRVVMIPAADQKEATHAIFLLNFIDDLQRRFPCGEVTVRRPGESQQATAKEPATLPRRKSACQTQADYLISPSARPVKQSPNRHPNNHSLHTPLLPPPTAAPTKPPEPKSPPAPPPPPAGSSPRLAPPLPRNLALCLFTKT